LLIVTALGALILAILPHLNFLGGGLIPVLQALIPAACLAVLVLSVPLLIFRKTRLPGLIVLVGALVGGFPALVPTASMGDAQSEQLTILSLNAEVGGANVGELSDLILARGADLVVLVEVDEAFLAELLSTRVAQELPYRSGTVSAGGIPGSVVLSRYALVDEGDVPLPAGVTVFDVFEGAGIGEGRKSVAIEVILRPSTRTLTDEEIDGVSARIVAQVAKATGAVLRA